MSAFSWVFVLRNLCYLQKCDVDNVKMPNEYKIDSFFIMILRNTYLIVSAVEDMLIIDMHT